MIGTLGDVLEKLSLFITWRDSSPEIMASVSQFQIEWVFQELFLLFSDEQTSVYRRIRSLPASLQKRLLISPELHYLFWTRHAQPQELADYLHRKIEAELNLVELSALDGEEWTALRDYCVTRGVVSYKAPTVQGIPVISSPSGEESVFPESETALACYSPVEREMIARQLSSVLELLFTMQPEASSLIHASVRSFDVMWSQERPHLPLSSSRRSSIGAVGLLNLLHSPHWTMPKQMNQIIHEAIHSSLYKIELKFPFYEFEAAANSFTAVSPWSGRKLYLHSFIHACFVWASLSAFWARHEQLDTHRRLYEKAVHGFEYDVWACLSAEARRAIVPELQEVLNTLFINARSSADA
jgi:hypothetical protein